MTSWEEFLASDQAQLLREDIRDKLIDYAFQLNLYQDADLSEPVVVNINGYIGMNRDVTSIYAELESSVEELEDGTTRESRYLTIGKKIYEITDIGVSDIDKVNRQLSSYEIMLLRARFSGIHWVNKFDILQPPKTNVERPDII